ncbi:nuclease-related domain-containing DEAD/DEAH box helicase [Luteolibacter marinus]|uniref:nuclease-related domain-containing DEAD/DEAH box helicase n=1 Tax=Luteolibacter marinus TaxID=2776705 RepID=UPI0018664EAE|nr:NERD domain-containing protein/DEAD/DEAH box helicase [Luteolibacter marinus]
MARWFIQRPQLHSHAAEIRVAEKLRELDDQWTVIWGYYYADKRGTEREGDFLVIGPAGGILVLEVKNTLPRWFSGTGRWEGETDNPVNQLMDEWSAVVGIVKAEGLPTWVAKALCIPGEVAPVDQEMVQGIRRSLLVLKNDLANWLPQVWLRIFGDKVRFSVLPKDREKILKRFGASADPAKARSFLDHTEELFQRQLTHRFQLLDQLRENRQLLVLGGTGTGKTWHAVEQAFRYASSGKAVLLLVYNLALTTQLRRLVGMRKLETGSIAVMGWEELFLQLARAGGDMEPPEGDFARLREFYEHALPGRVRSLLEDPNSRKDWPRFDALVADEAQDHDTAWDATASGGWWDVYRALLHDGGDAPASIFYDPAQRPPFRNPERFDPRGLCSGWSQPAHVHLQPALRYTRPLWTFFQQHRHPAINPMLEALGRGDHLPEGPEPEVHRVADDVSGRACVEQIILRWNKEGLCRPDEVLILHKESNVGASALGDTRVLAGRNLRDVLEDTDGAIRHTSINKAKGLDARAVILVGCPLISVTTTDFDAYTWFMGVSRARQLLAVVEIDN